MKFKFNAHQLEETAQDALSLTPEGLTGALKHAKALGFSGMTLVPLLFHSDLTAPVAAEIAATEGMKIDTCLFLPGERFKPHSKDGKRAAMDEVLRQGAFQQLWKRAGVGGDTLWGPSGQGFMGEFNLDGHREWIHMLSLGGAHLNLRIAVEVLNQLEQSTAPKDIFNLTADVIEQAATNGHVGFHYDTVHAWMRMERQSIEFFRKHKDKIFVVELANRDRRPFDQDFGIDFMAHMAEIPNLHPDVQLGTEAFCHTVIAKLKIQHIYGTPFLGQFARERNATYLRGKGWM